MTPASKCEAWTSAQRATPSEIVELQRLGFKVEDLGAEYGLGHQGAFRRVNIVAGEFQQDADSHSEAEAWAAAKGAAVANERAIPMNKRDVNAAMLEAQQDVEDGSLALTLCKLQCLGYTVKALGHKPGLESEFRWTNTHAFEFQNIGLVSNSDAEAWARAAETWVDKHDRKGLLSATHSGDLTPAQLEGHHSHGRAKLLSSTSWLS